MRVLHVVTQTGTYGGERFVPALARAQRALGIEAHIATIYDGIPPHEVPAFTAGRANGDPRFFFRLVRHIRELRPDVVHTHLAHGKIWGRLAAIAGGVPHLVHTEHANDFGGSRGYRSVGRLLHRRTARVVALGRTHAERIARIERVDAGRIAVIPNGVEDVAAGDGAAVRRELGLGDAPVVLLLGRLDDVKRPLLALDAIAHLAGAMPVELVVAGDGPLRGALEQRARARAIERRVHVLGYRTDVSALLAAADAVVNTSSTEAMPLSLLEALVAGARVASAPWPGAAELVGHVGAVADSDRPAHIAAALASVLQRGRLAPAERAAARERFSIEACARAHVALYEELTMTEARIDREKRLQDERFAQGGSRGTVDRAYAITGASHGYYKRRIAGDAPGRRVLEIGCGLGESALEVARAGGIVTGIDLSDVAVGVAREKAQDEHLNATFAAMNAEQTAFPNASFDIVCGGAILHHLDTERAYREISRLLDPGGYALFLEPLGYNPFINLYRRLTPAIRTPDEHPLLERDLTLARRFFADVRITYYYLTALLLLPIARTALGRRLLGAANAFDRALFRLFPALRRQAWFIVLELRAPTAAG